MMGNRGHADSAMTQSLASVKRMWPCRNLLNRREEILRAHHLQDSKDSFQLATAISTLVVNVVFVVVVVCLTLHPSIAIFQTSAIGVAIVFVFGPLQMLLFVCMVIHWFYWALLRYSERDSSQSEPWDSDSFWTESPDSENEATPLLGGVSEL